MLSHEVLSVGDTRTGKERQILSDRNRGENREAGVKNTATFKGLVCKPLPKASALYSSIKLSLAEPLMERSGDTRLGVRVCLFLRKRRGWKKPWESCSKTNVYVLRDGRADGESVCLCETRINMLYLT